MRMMRHNRTAFRSISIVLNVVGTAWQQPHEWDAMQREYCERGED